MSTTPPETADVYAELGDQERDDLEFKRDGADRDVIRKAICALANDLGRRERGTLLIGVDKHGQPTGVDTSDPELLKICEFRSEGLILPPPVISVAAAVFKGMPVIRVDVSPSRCRLSDSTAGSGSGWGPRRKPRPRPKNVT